MSSHTDNAWAGQSEGRAFDPHWLQQVLRFVALIAPCNTWSLGWGAIRGAHPALCRVGGATCQLDLPSLMPLSVAGCGRLLLGVPHWATSVDY